MNEQEKEFIIDVLEERCHDINDGTIVSGWTVPEIEEIIEKVRKLA